MYKLDHVVLEPYSWEVETWCRSTLGKEWHWHNNQQGLWYFEGQTYLWYFAEEKHANWFSLRFSK